jgi:hypothetical protein
MERGIRDATTRATETSEQDLFRSRLDQTIDMKHALVKLARATTWKGQLLEGAAEGEPPLPVHRAEINIRAEQIRWGHRPRQCRAARCA